MNFRFRSGCTRTLLRFIPAPLLAPAAALLHLPAHAVEPPPDAIALAETVTITGSREPVPLSAALQDITVIDRAAIESYSGASLESLLDEQAGLQLSTNGGLGAVSNVFIRGANSDSTLLLIDGMRYGSASAGGPLFYNLPLELIDHIEIVRGPLSALYGSDAAGGVIQIFTRRGEPGFHPSAAVTVGSEKYGAIDAGVRGGAGTVDYAVQAGGKRTDGYTFTNPGAGVFYNPNRDGFSQQSASANVGYTFAPGWSVRIQGLGAHGNGEFSDGFDPSRPQLTGRNIFDTTVGNVVLQGKAMQDWSTTLRYGVSRDNYDVDIAVNAFDLARFTTVQQLASWQNDIATPIGTLLAGVEHLEQSVNGEPTTFPVDRRTVNSVLLGLTGKWGPHAWQADGRSDQNSQFGHQWSGAIAYGYQFAPAWRGTASMGTSFVMPSFDELYYPGFGNPLLRPQRGATDELSLRWKVKSEEARLTVYDSRFRDLIADVGPNFEPVNIGGSRIRGVTLETSAQFGAVTLSSALDAMSPRDLTNDTELPRRSRRTFSMKVDWAISEKWAAGARVHAAGPSYDDTLNLQPLGGYGMLSAYGSWNFLPKWQAALRLDNLTDHHVQPAYGFNSPPRQWFLTLRYGGI
ncbi:MAG: TonB-dependent receptor [Burkholderiaceae bacterium]|nr:TonB-dependent receptor [Burkholderiaceae bacterium]